jgi:hypothetical protein
MRIDQNGNSEPEICTSVSELGKKIATNKPF